MARSGAGAIHRKVRNKTRAWHAGHRRAGQLRITKIGIDQKGSDAERGDRLGECWPRSVVFSLHSRSAEVTSTILIRVNPHGALKGENG